jgi:hypothetical protein
MSKSQYSFQASCAKKVQPIRPERLVPQNQNKSSKQSIKALVMEQFDQFIQLKEKNQKIKYLSETREQISKEIVAIIGLLQNLSKQVDQSNSKEKTLEYNQKLNHLNLLYNQLNKEYTDLLQKELKFLFEGWPDLFEKIIEGVDRETLEHVLTVFEEYQTGRLNENEAVGHGLDYMSILYKLPKDFFDKGAINQFTKKLHEQENK